MSCRIKKENKMNKAIKSLIITAAMFVASASVFAAAKKSIVCTTYPEYDWIMNILGNRASAFNITLLQNKGVDLHSYQPSIKDVATISTSDLFVYVGGESDAWVEKVIADAENKNLIAVNMMEVLGEKIHEEEIIEGMQAEEEEHHHEHGAKSVSTFDDHEVRDRNLSDWEGEWTSPYSLVLDGTLDEVWQHKSEDGKMSPEEYKEYYKKGYKTDIKSISIKNNRITFVYENGNKVSSTYKYIGHYIQHWSSGTKAAMYRFVADNKKDNVPQYIELNDHIIEPCPAEHFHIRMSNESFDAIIDPEGNWPTFFPKTMSGEEIAEDLMGGHHHHEKEPEYDEHIWLSIKNAIELTENLSKKIQKLDSANSDLYKKNTEGYVKQLKELDSEYNKIISAAENKTILFGDRYPFRYLSEDYGLKYYAAFVGCSAETEASFETIIFLANKVDELRLNAVLTIEKSDKKIAKTVVSNTKNKNQQILELDSLQSITTKEIKAGRNYLSAMRKNLEVLKKALN